MPALRSLFSERRLALLRRYFYSGWAFLIPYLFVYLLYHVTKEPVNAAGAAGERLEAIGQGTDITPLALSPSPFPCLLHVYWALHAIHVILAGFALWSWVRDESRRVISNKCSAISGDPSPYHSHLTPYLLSLITRALPWALLALLFYIPGAYLEWPSDPWEHLRRINEWRIHDTVGAHSSWMKSAYFIPYSLLSWCIGLRQLFWLDFYYTGICLLLCWQYYRFSRACGLGERASMVFVIIQALLFGNNIFSFYRYYGISSSIYAQLGAIALTRIVLDWASWGRTNLHRGGMEIAASNSGGLPPSDSWLLTPGSLFASRPSFWHLPSVLRLLPIALCLLPLIAFNHIQGIGIAGLGIAAIIVWRLIEWKRSALWWLIGGTLLINALFLWLYPRPAIIETYRAQGWLNAWYGFNILDLTSPAGDRMLQVVSAFGLVNLAAALLLCMRNNVLAWLTLLPLLALLTPATAVPFAEQAFRVSNIVTFQRMLFAMPPMLAIVAAYTCIFRRAGHQIASKVRLSTNPSLHVHRCIHCAIPILLIAILILVQTPAPAYNRLHNVCMHVPDDLQLLSVWRMVHNDLTNWSRLAPEPTISSRIEAAKIAIHPFSASIYDFRVIDSPVSAFLIERFAFLKIVNELGLLNTSSQSNKAPGSGHTWHAEFDKPFKHTNLIPNADSLAPEAWVTLGGTPPKFIRLQETLPNYPSYVLQNSAGQASEVFTAYFIPIDRAKSYLLEMSVRQQESSKAVVFLAVAWYDAKQILLESYRTEASGAGRPRGWGNGTYSYFGLIEGIPSSDWKTFRITFGLAEPAAIPERARYIRVGALLNYKRSPNAVVQLTKINLQEKTTPSVLTRITPATSAYTPYSYSGSQSTHWPAQQLILDMAGGSELRSLTSAPRASKQPTILR